MAKSTKTTRKRGKATAGEDWTDDEPVATSKEGGIEESDIDAGELATDTKAGDTAKVWLAEIESAKTRAKNWHGRGLEIIERYRNERASSKDGKKLERKTAILWSNTDVLMSHLAVELGTPDVKRSFQQPGKKTKIARTAAEILEKVMKVENQGFDVTHEFENSIEDHLLPGRGQVWLDLDDAEDEEGEMNWVEAKIVHVAWDGFLTGHARKWQEVPWVGRLLLFSKQDLRKSFPKYAAEIPLNYMVDVGNTRGTEQNYKRAAVWEIWNKETLERIYVAEDFDHVLQVDGDPYHLRGFFPCPPALYAVKTSGDLDPVALYSQYEDQAVELDRLTTRAYRLIETLKYCGVYAFLEGDDALPDITNLEDGQFLPVRSFKAIAEKGGLKDLFMVRDLEQIMVAIKGIYEQRAQLVQTIYEITGIADIIRGSSDPRETLGAQKLKSRFGSNRSAMRQRTVQRFVRDAYRLKAELIAEHYSREQLQEMTGILIPTKADQDKAKMALAQAKQAMQQAQQGQQQVVQQLAPPAQPGSPPQHQAMQAAALQAQKIVPQPQFDPESLAEIRAIMAAVAWEDIQQVLRSNIRRLFMVDVETDDTAFEDEETVKKQALEFSGALFKLMQETLPAIKASPELMPLAKETVLFVADSFKVGQAFEDIIGETFDNIAKQPPAPAPADGKGMAEAAKAKAVQATTQSRLQNDVAERQAATQEHAMTMQERMQNMKQDQEIHQSEMQARMAELQGEREKLQIELAEARARLAAAGLPMQPLGLQQAA